MQDFLPNKNKTAGQITKVNFILIFFTIFLFSNLHAQRMQIGIMRAFSVSGILLTYGDGDYQFKSDSSIICEMSKTDKISLTRNGNGIRIYKNEISLGTYTSVYIHEKKANQFLNIQCTSPVSKTGRKYMNDFTIKPEGQDKLKVINEVEMENYLAGVIESEGGGGKHLEYYKVQAVLSRTYALDHLFKHNKDGFQLCDEVHCQAYLNMMRFTPNIKKAVEETHGVVMVSTDYKLADGFFFANCGGQTSPADYVWNTNVSYCKSVRDTFCIKSKQANWEKRIPLLKWQNYLETYYGYPTGDSLYGPLIFHFEQPTRAAFFIAPQFGIPLRDLREEFKLKSTWFSCHPEGDDLVLKGKGFGHGVGLCQEGAMKMANYGYNFEQILKYYFTGIQLYDYSVLNFINQKVREMYGL